MRLKQIIFIIIVFTLVFFNTNQAEALNFKKFSLKSFLGIPITTIKKFNPFNQQPACSDYDSDSAYFAGEASVIYFYMGDDEFTTSLQETMLLSKAFQGDYDYRVLFYDTDATALSHVSSSQAINQADEVHDPTQANFLDVLEGLFDDGYIVDIYIISHGNVNGSGDAYFSAMDSSIKGSEITDRFENYGCGEVPIRMVWSGACYHEAMNDVWIDLGAKVVSGARDVNFYPNQFGRFATEWTSGEAFETALDLSNDSATRTAVQIYIYFMGWGYAGQGDCPVFPAPNVLGENDCAEDFFTDLAYSLDTYHPNWSGSSNMTYSSKKIIDGDYNIDRDSILTWEMPD